MIVVVVVGVAAAFTSLFQFPALLIFRPAVVSVLVASSRKSSDPAV
jgi:hypothetical protein